MTRPKLFSKVVVLENDEEFKGLPISIEYLLKTKDIKDKDKEIWYWFSEDFRQHTQGCITRFDVLCNSSFFISQPSFCGFGNSFDKYVNIFFALYERGIKLSLGVIYANFYWYIVGWIGGKHRESEKIKSLNLLRMCLEYHDIYYTEKILVNESETFEQIFTAVTYSSLMENIFIDGDKVRIKEKGQIVELEYVYLSDKIEHCAFVYNDGIPDDKRRDLGKPIREYKRHEIEKV